MATNATDASLATAATGRRTILARRLALLVVCLAVFLSALDQTMVVTVLEPVAQDIGVSLTRIDRAAWIVSGYLLGYVAALPLMGRLADLWGRRVIFTSSLILFSLGSLFCALAPALGSPIAPDPTTLDGALLTPLYLAAHWLLAHLAPLGLDASLARLDLLIGARFVQAIGGGALVPVAMAVAGDLFGPSRRSLALGLIGAVAEAGGALGPLWGAAITSRWGWHEIFFINIPLAALLLGAGLWSLPRVARLKGGVDLAGALLFGASLTCLVLGIGPQSGGIDIFQASTQIAPNPWLLGAAVVLLAGFILTEALLRAPVTDVRRFRIPAFASAAALSFLVGVAFIAAIALIPLYFRTLQPTATVFTAAFALLRMTLLIPVGAFVGGWLSRHFGCPPAAVLGTLLTSLGLFLMSHWPAYVGDTQITVAAVIAGLGFGLSVAPINVSALNTGGAGQEGMAASVVTVLRMAGMVLGVAWLTLWGATRLQTLLHRPGVTPALGDLAVAAHQVYSELFLIAAVIALLGVIPALLLWRRPRAAQAAEVQLRTSYDARTT